METTIQIVVVLAAPAHLGFAETSLATSELPPGYEAKKTFQIHVRYTKMIQRCVTTILVVLSSSFVEQPVEEQQYPAMEILDMPCSWCQH
jgi:hypothetical protein